MERTKSCEMHFHDCAHQVAKATWSSRSRKKFITIIHGIYTAETPGSYEQSAVPSSNGLQINPREPV